MHKAYVAGVTEMGRCLFLNYFNNKVMIITR